MINTDKARLPWKIMIVAAASGLTGIIIGVFAARSDSESTDFEKSTTSSTSREVTSSGPSRFSKSSKSSRSTRRTSKNNQVFSTVFNQLSGSDLRSLAHSAITSKSELDNSAFLKVLITEWAKTNPSEALDFAKENDRSDLIYFALRKMAETDMEGSLQWMHENISNITKHSNFLSAIFQGTAVTNPSQAIAQIKLLPSGPQRDQVLSMTIDTWAKEDPEAVFQWLEKEEFSQQIPYLYDQVVNRYILSSPKEASALITEMQDSTSKANFASKAAYNLAKTDVTSAVNWVESLDGENKKFALKGLLENWAQKEGGIGALDFVKTQSNESNYTDLFSVVAMQLSQSSPDELEQKLSTLSQSEQIIAIQQLGQVYSANIPEKAKKLIDSLEPGPVRDAALSSSLNAIRRNNITQAFDLTETISDKQTRIKEMKLVILEWMPVDSEAAELALQNSSLIPENQKRIILNWANQRVKPRNEYLIPAK